MTPTTVCIFFKSRSLTSEFCLRRFQFFQSRRFTPQKRGLNFSSAGAAYLKTGSFHFSKAAPRVSKSGTFNFSKAGASRPMPPTAVCNVFSKIAYGGIKFFKAGVSRLNTACSGFNFFKSRRFTPQKRGLNFSKVGAAYLKTRSFHFSKARATRFNKRHSQFFKSLCFTPQCRLRLYFFQKPPMAASKCSNPALRA